MKQMIVKLLLAGVFVFVACTTDVDDEEVDTFDASVVCPADGLNKYGMPNRGTFIDERDGQEYKYTTIGDQVWMAQNLNYETERSVVYECQEFNCEGFGRYYSIKDDGTGYGPIDRPFMETLCPAGWHVPTRDEWWVLFNNVGGEDSDSSGYRLQSADPSYYNLEYRKPGVDACAFNSLPTGEYGDYIKFLLANIASAFWTSTASNIYGIYVVYVDGFTGEDSCCSSHYTIRCLKD